MPEVLTLVVVAVLGVLVGAVGVGAYRLSVREQSREQTVDVAEPPLSGEVLSVLTALPGITIVVDRDDRIERADATAYAKGLARGSELTHPVVLDLVHRVREQGLTLTGDFSLPRSTIARTATLDFQVRVAALPAGRVLILAEDRTLQRRTEATRRDFTANVSHELKTPVGAIRLLAETIAENPGDEEAVAHFAPRLVREAERLSALVQDIIDLSRIQGPDALDAAEMVDIDEVVTSAIARQETTAESAGIVLVGPREPTGALVWGSRDMLVTAVRNLVDNAVRYSQSGSHVSIGTSVRDDLVSISVVDSGIGIPEEDQERIFERFYRVDPARSRNTGGTGLGLSIVKHVASDHGGTVTVWSRPGRGSTFTLLLPVAESGAGSEGGVVAPGGVTPGGVAPGDEGGAVAGGSEGRGATGASPGPGDEASPSRGAAREPGSPAAQGRRRNGRNGRGQR